MKSMLTHFLFAVLLMLPVVSIDAVGQDEDSINRDLTELLEMQLADAKQENVRLSAKVSEQAASLEALRKASANDAGQDKVRKLESENVLLKAELEKLDEDLKRAAEARKALTRQIEDVRGELAQADTAPVPPVVTAGDYDELRARRKNLEDENAILKREIDGLTKRAETAEADRDRIKGDLDRLFAEDKRSDEKPDASRRELDRLKKVLAATQDELEDVRSSAIDDKQAVGLAKELEEMKAVEAQRKEALDDLFKQLAGVKADLKSRDAEVATLRAEVNAGREALSAKDTEVKGRDERIADGQERVESLQQDIVSLRRDLDTVRSEKEDREDELRDEIAARQATQARLDRIQLTDEQRKRAMDDVLTKLADAERLNAERKQKISDLERSLADTIDQNTGTVGGLENRVNSLKADVARLEQELETTAAARDTALAGIKAQKDAVERDAARIVELEADLARVTTTDGQRKKAMDNLLLEVASMEEERETLRSELSDARRQIKKLGARVDDQKVAVSPDLSEEMAKLEEENSRLKRKVAALEASAREVGEAPSPGAGDRSGEAELSAMERTEWERTKADLEDEIAEMRKAAEKHASVVGDLKADLAEAERAKGQLSGEVEQLRNRKVDVRSSDLFQEMEKVNVTLREKLVQIEGERQRLDKQLKKLEKRDERFDDEIGHEKDLRLKAETELTDARAREVEYQDLIERMMAQVPQLEKQIVEQDEENRKLKQELTDKNEDLRAMTVELEKREHRLIKAERVAEVLESAREDVLRASDREKLDMHYNMAAVYAREGKFSEAEQEYLHALRLDPTDADVHYNLGILYDDELKSPAKAVVHYRRYLKLSPHGPDADQVRNWLMKLEMKMK